MSCGEWPMQRRRKPDGLVHERLYLVTVLAKMMKGGPNRWHNFIYVTMDVFLWPCFKRDEKLCSCVFVL